MADRICCINPACRRTAASEKFPDSRYIICGKCWKVLPPRIRQRFKQLKARDRVLGRLVKKPPYSPDARNAQWQRVADRYETLWDRLDDAIRIFFTAGETPQGLDNFLEENGLG